MARQLARFAHCEMNHRSETSAAIRVQQGSVIAQDGNEKIIDIESLEIGDWPSSLLSLFSCADVADLFSEPGNSRFVLFVAALSQLGLSPG